MTLDKHEWTIDRLDEDGLVQRFSFWVRLDHLGGYSQWIDRDDTFGRKELDDPELLAEFADEILRLAARVKELEEAHRP